MKIKLPIFILLILCICSSCDKKSTDPPDDDKYRFTVNARVVDLQGNPVKCAGVTLLNVYNLSPDIPSIVDYICTNDNGSASFPCAVFMEKNEVGIYSWTLSHCSDTVYFTVEYDGFVYNRGEDFVLKYER